MTDALQIARSFTNGTANVIVNLAPGQALRNADFSSKTSLANVRAENQKAQQDVLNRLPASDVKVGFRFDNIAGFSAAVTASGLRALQADPRVVSIEPVFTLEAHLAQGIPLMHGMTYRSSYNGSGTAIAICDTGVDYNHARLGGGGFPNSKVLGGYNFGDGDANPIPNTQAHGTCCAGIAAGDLGTVGDYIGGVAYNAKVYAVKISSGTSTSATTAAMVAAWDWCVTHQNDNPAYPIMVISTSFGGGRFFSACDSATPSMTTAANNAVAAGITVLASSGNDGYCDSIAWPACISSVISVGAVYDAAFGHYLPCVNSASCAPKVSTTGCATGWYADDLTAADKVTSYANVASFLTLMAPANQCYTLDITGSSGYSNGDYYDSFGGTSAACPYAAGAVACLQSAAKALTGSYLTPQAVRTRLLSSGDNVTDTRVAITKPRVNLEQAIQSLGTNPVLNFVSATLSSGNGNQSVDPNECSELKVIVRNEGRSAATNV
ncbi:MAG TPA: S8 family serine peptidase, partial [Verrucomicrobiae bacterium]|nr:S8 family serine peptidase [Verrucomicrobiae bacterium]